LPLNFAQLAHFVNTKKMQLASRQARPTVAGRHNRARTVSVSAAKTPGGPRLAIVGVTGAVGQEFLQASFCARCIAAAAVMRPSAAVFVFGSNAMIDSHW
jgi:hypothetical protein